MLQIQVYSDVVCPWCYIGKRRLERALSEVIGPYDIHWLPYLLNPDMPEGGLERREYRTRKFGSWERSLALDAQVSESGRGEGIDFRHEKMLNTPNTLMAHQLIWLARRNDTQQEVVEALFRAYFVEGLDIGDPSVLRRIAESFEIGWSKKAATAVKAQLDANRYMAISGVPYFVLNQHLAVSGAQEPEVFLRALGLA